MIKEIELYNIFKSKYPSVYFASIIRDNGYQEDMDLFTLEMKKNIKDVL